MVQRIRRRRRLPLIAEGKTGSERQGFCIRRYQNMDVVQNIEGVLMDIERALTPLSSSPPQGGRGRSEISVR